MQADELIAVVRAHADEVLDRCGDRYGDRATPLLVDGLAGTSDDPICWEGNVLSNPARQQNFARLLIGLSALTGDGAYRDRAHECLGFALTEMRDPASDMQYWGAHNGYDLTTTTPLMGNHELKCAYPAYRILHQIDPEATLRFTDGFWHKHVYDWATLLFNRHGEYEDWDRQARWAGEYAGGPVPIVENRLLSFINTGSDLVLAGAMATVLGGEAEPLTWALRLLSRYDDIRHPDTGLGGYQFNHRDPCRVRESFKPPYDENPAVNETTVLGTGLISTRYGRAALTWMNLYEELGPERGEDFLRMVEVDLAALARYSWDEGDHTFRALLVDGTPLSPQNTNEGVGYCPPRKLEPLPANGLMFLSYARGYRITGNEHLRDIALSLAVGMGWGDLDDGGQPVPEEACGLVGLLDLAAAGGEWHLAQAGAAAGHLVAEAPDGFLATGKEQNLIDNPVPLALLHVAAAQLGRTSEMPVFYAGSCAFDPKIIIARRS